MFDTIEEDEEKELEVEELEIVLEDVPKKKKKSKPTEEYINKEEMWQEYYDYYKSLGDAYNWTTQKVVDKTFLPVISDKLCTMLYEIAVRVGYLPNFINYSFLDEMREDAKLKMIKAVRDGSFNCFLTAKIISIKKDGDNEIIEYLDEKFMKKKGKYREKIRNKHDVIETRDNGELWLTCRQDAFSYQTMTTMHAFLNRIKKEKQLDSTKKAYQEETWDRLLSSEQFVNYKHPKILEHDENEYFYEE